MGSLPEGTLCAYCAVNTASYIPDGCCGPLCGEPEGESCMDKGLLWCWESIVQLRLTRLWKGLVRKLSSKAHIGPLDVESEAGQCAASYLWKT